MAIEVGQEAPDFTLVNEQNEKVTLSELRGTPVVLVFYPFDFSGICTGEMCEIRDNYGSWQERGARVYGISRDSRFTHAAFKEKEGFTHELLADMKGEVASRYGVWNEAAAAAERATFVVDREGKIAYAIHNAIPDARDHSEVEKHIAA
ncbi:MAG: redoxin domain-containing protein [Dehalococcoidia bacterium]|nr:redoxin domain-containing protein [Dehalococcoidia bacterium]